MTLMVIIPFSPFACAVVTTTILLLTFFVGRFYGIKKVMNYIREEMTK